MTDNTGNDKHTGDDRGHDEPRKNNAGREDGGIGTPTADTSAETGGHSTPSGHQGAADSAAGKSVKQQDDKPAPKSSATGTEEDTAAGGADRPSSAQAGPAGSTSGNHDNNEKEAPAGAAAGARPDPESAGAHKGPNGGDSDDKKPRKGGKAAAVIAIIALLIALIAGAGAGWLWYRGQQRLAAFDNRMDNLQATLDSSNIAASAEAAVQEMVMPRLAEIRARISEVADANAQQARALSDLRRELQETRLQVAGMAQQLQGSARRLQLQQIEHLLLVAQRRLRLYNAPQQAVTALKLASEAISRLNDPRLFDVRKRVIDAIAALNALPSPDVQGIALTLTSFIEQVSELPLASDVPANYQPVSAPQGGGAADDSGAGKGSGAGSGAGGGKSGIDLNSGWQQFLQSVGQAVQGMVTIRHTGDTAQPALMPAKQVYFLTHNLMLELRSARLALLEGNSALYHTSLSTAIEWLKQYFDTGNSTVQAMIERLEQMQDIKLDVKPPDISGTLVALRNYMQARSREDRAASAQGGPNRGAAAGGGQKGAAKATRKTDAAAAEQRQGSE